MEQQRRSPIAIADLAFTIHNSSRAREERQALSPDIKRLFICPIQCSQSNLTTPYVCICVYVYIYLLLSVHFGLTLTPPVYNIIA